MNLIVDSNSLFATQFFGFSNGLYGFYNVLVSLINKYNPDEVHLAFDSDTSWRKAFYSKYKANRVAKPEGYYDQLSTLKTVLAESGFALYEVPEYEADDILASLLRDLGRLHTIIYSGDKDILQLVGETVYVQRNTRQPKWTMRDVEVKYGVLPFQIPSYLALCGDTVDGISGVYGIGPKKATQLLANGITLTQLYDDLPNGTMGRTLRTYEEDAFTALKLTTLCQPSIELRYGSYNLDSLRRKLNNVQSSN